MWYAIISEDHDGSLDNRLAARPAHFARLKAMCDDGRLLIAGPHPAVDSPDPGAAGFTGSLVVVDFWWVWILRPTIFFTIVSQLYCPTDGN